MDNNFIPKLIQLSLEEKIKVYQVIQKQDLEIGELIAKGAGGLVYQGRWNNRYISIQY